MYTFEDIKARSLSRRELVVSYSDAMELLHIFGENSTRILGWEGWLRHEQGALSHSIQHQGTVDLSKLSISAAHALIRSTIMQANWDHQELPELKNTELFFCITIDSCLEDE